MWHSHAMHGRTLRVLIAIGGTVVSAAAEGLAIDAGQPALSTLLHLTIGLTYLYGGLAIWDHEPTNSTGRLMTAVGLTWFVQAVQTLGAPVLSDLGEMLYDVPTVFIFALVLVYPSGHLETRGDRIGLAILAVGATALNMIQFAPAPLVVNEGINGLFVGTVLVTMAIVLIMRRWVRAPARSRRELLPVVVAGSVLMIILVLNLARRIFEVSDALGDVILAIDQLAPAAIPVALLIGFFRRSEYRMQALIDAIPDRIIRISRDGIPTNVRGVGAGPGASPTAVAVARTFDQMRGWVGVEAHSATQRALDQGGVQTFDFSIETDVGRRDFEARVAASGQDEATAIIRDFTDQRAIDAELRRSRARIVEVADAERRRLERDLHDGAQQRLVALSLSLRLLRSKLHEARGLDPSAAAAADDAAAAAAADDAAQELKLAIAELRELARGIHPAILTEAGLGAALTSLAERSVVPAVVTDQPDRRLPPAVEATAYFVVSEALANTAKHAAATRVGIGARCTATALRIEVSDDGIGGADRGRGTGIEGLHDRVAALDGTLTVESPPGQGTLVVAEIPLV